MKTKPFPPRGVRPGRASCPASNRKTIGIFLILTALFAFPDFGHSQSRLKNLQPDTLVSEDSNPFHFRQAGPFAFFWTQSLKERRLWRTDGTEKNTLLLLEHQWDPYHYSVPDGIGWKNLFFFAGFSPTTGVELFRSDGTPQGTYLVKDLAPGRSPYGLKLPLSSQPKDFVSLPQGVFFQAWTPRRGWTLFFSDGTSKGSIALLQPKGKLFGLTAWGNRLLFLFRSASYGETGLGVSDGTIKGTKLFFKDPLVTIHPPSKGFPVVKGKFFFAARKTFSNKGEELWVSDGTAKGTKLLKDLWPGTESSSPREFTASGSWAFFSAETPKEGRELWRTDGTIQGTTLVKDLAPGGSPLPDSGNPARIKAVKGGILFSAWTPKTGCEPWFSDGSKKGTRQLGDLIPGPEGSKPFSFLDLGNQKVFLTLSDDGRRTLFRTDTTRQGTVEIKKLSLKKEVFFIPFALDPFGSRFFFRHTGSEGTEPWISDGTVFGTKLLKNIGQKRFRAKPSYSQGFCQLGDKVFFSFTGENSIAKLVQSNGIEEGTRIRFEGPSAPLQPLGETLLYKDYSKGLGRLLAWNQRSNRKTILFEFSRLLWRNKLDRFYLLNGRGIFFGAASSEPNRYWSTDGTPQGTRPFFPLVSGSLKEPPIFSNPLRFGNKMLIAGPFRIQKDRSVPLWLTDGTKQGSHLLGSLPTGGGITQLHLSGHRLGKRFVFSFLAQKSGLPNFAPALLATDGNKITALAQGIQALVPQFKHLGQVLVFPLKRKQEGEELWITDGTPKGTKLLKDLEPGPSSSNPHALVKLGNRIIFSAQTKTTGKEFFITDGTPKGTKLLKDIFKGPSSGCLKESFPIRVGSRFVIFLAQNKTHTPQFWISDGTSAGTIPYGKALPLPVPPQPLQEARFLKGTLFFPWKDSEHGGEPWTLNLPASARSYRFGCREELSLEATDPTLGTSMHFEGDALTAQSPLILLLGSPPPLPFPLENGCWLGIDPFRQMTSIPLRANKGHWSLSFPLPKIPSLSGLFLHAQALHPKQGGGFTMSQPVELHLGTH